MYKPFLFPFCCVFFQKKHPTKHPTNKPTPRPSPFPTPKPSPRPLRRPSPRPSPRPTTATIQTVICGNPIFSELCRQLTINNLFPTLEIQQKLTFFAPTNDAFDRYYADTGSRHLSSDADHRSLYNPIIVDPKEVLLYHAYLKKVYYYNDLECNKQILSAVQGEYSTTECENDDLVKFQVGTGNPRNLRPRIEDYFPIQNGRIWQVNNVLQRGEEPTKTPSPTRSPTKSPTKKPTMEPTKAPMETTSAPTKTQTLGKLC